MRRKTGFKRLSALLSLALCVISLCGCDSLEIDSLVSVLGIAIDYQKDTGEFILTAETAKILSENSQPLETVVLSGKGKTLVNALEDMSQKASGRLYYQHAEILVFGEDTARDGVGEIIDTIMRAAHAQRVIKVLVVKNGTGADFFKVKPRTKPFLSKELSESISIQASRFGLTDEGKMHHLYNNIPAGLADMVSSAMITGEGENTGVKLDGPAIMNNGRLSGYLSLSEAKLCLLAMGKLHTGFLAFQSTALGVPLSFGTIAASTDCRPTMEDGRLTMKISISITGTIPEIMDQTPTLDRIKETDVVHDIERQLANQVETTVRKVIDEWGADLFFFKPQIQNRYRSEWVGGWAQDWPNVYKATVVKCVPSVIVTSNGVTQ